MSSGDTFANIIEKIKYFIGLDDEEDYEVGKLYDYEKREVEKSSTVPNSKNVNNYVNTGKGLKIYKVKKYDDIINVIEDLKQGKSVVVNLQEVEGSIKKKVFNFLIGGIYALDGTIKKADKEIFVVSPDEIENESETKIEKYMYVEKNSD